MRNFKRLSPFFIVLIFLISGSTPPTEEQRPEEVELHGRIVCLAEEMHAHYKVELFNKHDHLYGVKTEDGKYYTLLRTSLAEALFVDERLHEKDLVINGRVFPRTQLLEVTRFYLSVTVFSTIFTTTAIHVISVRLHLGIATAVRHRWC